MLLISMFVFLSLQQIRLAQQVVSSQMVEDQVTFVHHHTLKFLFLEVLQQAVHFCDEKSIEILDILKVLKYTLIL